jgi:ATP-dependent RNA helicase RhlB
MEFKELDLHPDLRRGLEDAGYVTCMPVQEKVFPHAFVGKDIYAQSQTGTGKTAAFLISIFQRIMTVNEARSRKVLILAPTRELAAQIEGEAEKLGKYLDIKCGAFYGGVSYGPQVDMLRNNVQVIIGTPGRVQDLVTQGKMLLRDVGFLVIDEADRMFDMGFIDDIRKLLRYLPKAEDRQTFLFSATLGLRVKDLAWEYMVDPVEISIEPEHVTVDLVTQELYHVGSHEKLPLLLGLLEREKPESAIIFCNQKFMTEELARRLKINGWDCEYIMGDLPQAKRTEIIEDLKAGRIHMLVATDVAARGLDVEALDLVVNYDVPEDAESYVHRIGRTARAGKAGKAITLACEKFVFGLPPIEKFIGNKIPVLPVDPALFGVDKSAGMHSGYSRDRGPARRDGRGGRPATQGRGGRPGGRDGHDGRGAPRGEGRGYGEGRGQGERRRDDYRRDDRRDQRQAPPREQRRPETAGARGPDGNPYSVSQDERLKRYKEKYGTQPGEGQSQGQGRGPEARNGEGKQRGLRQQAPQGAREGQGGRGGQQGQQRGGKAPNQGQGQRQQRPQQGKGQPQKAGGQKPQARKGAPVAAAAAAKKPGILDRIKGIFGKKN